MKGLETALLFWKDVIMTNELIKRINELSKKSKAEGLTDEEKAEQKALREQYIKEFRQGVKNTLDNVYTLDEKGNKVPLKKFPQA